MIIRAGETTLPTFAETRDLSVDGFFCSVPEPLGIGEKVRCLILLDEAAAASAEHSYAVCLEAEAEVVRIVSSRLEYGFGVGCCTLNFRVVPTAAWAEAAARCSALEREFQGARENCCAD